MGAPVAPPPDATPAADAAGLDVAIEAASSDESAWQAFAAPVTASRAERPQRTGGWRALWAGRAGPLWTLAALLATSGLLLRIPAALALGALVGGLLSLYLRRLQRALAGAHGPLGIHARLRPPPQPAAERGALPRVQRAGQPLDLALSLEAPATAWGARLRLATLQATAGLDVATGGEEVVLGPGVAPLSAQAVPKAAALHRVFGAVATLRDPIGLVEVDVYLACPWEIAALPRLLPLDPRVLAETRRTVLRSAGGQRPDRIQGQGDELRELREHQPGDPFKHIAWKASARRGRLMARAFEHERARAVYVVLDAGPTMRAGPQGLAALDAGMEVVHALAEGSARMHIPFGVALVDGEILDSTPALIGKVAIQRSNQALLDVRRVVDARWTDIGEIELLRMVAEAMRVLDHAHLPEPTGAEAWLAWRQRVVMAALARLPERERAPALRGPDPAPRADLSILRRFCRAADLPLPYRRQTPAAARVAGLVAGLHMAMAARRGPFAVVLLSDFQGLRAQLPPLWRAMAAAHHQGHQVTVISLTDADDALGDLASSTDDFDLAHGLLKADEGARETLHAALREGCRRCGAGLLLDPARRSLVRLWAAGGWAGDGYAAGRGPS